MTRMYIGDLHIHSRYSRATSKECTPEHLELWARRKGIHIVGTGDFTHPKWREELTEKLTPAEDGLYRLKEEYQIQDASVAGGDETRFVVTGEISSIYKKNGKVRKVHSLILLPSLEDAQKISVKLEQIGNIHSDGRPILGLDCRDLLEILLELCPRAVYVPAHIWTPHFSLFGAFSGFNTVEECYEDLTPYIHAVETGLSSDPPMNWRVSALDRFQLISNSDAHSPAKLGREANLFGIDLSYEGLSEAIQTGRGLEGTIEFFPEEGKYHMDGHRKCGLCLKPAETESYQGICPVCGRKITIGVSHRVEELSDRPEGFIRENARLFESLVPLPEVIGASEGRSATSVKVQREYQRMLKELGPEFEILRRIPTEEIRRVSGSRIAEGIERLRKGQVERIPGFDGEYGVIRLFTSDELENTEGQMDFFDILGTVPEVKNTDIQEKEAPLAEKAEEMRPESREKKLPGSEEEKPQSHRPEPGLYGLNQEQESAVRSLETKIAVIAGPGTGKTKTLVSRLQYLLEYRRVRPSEITAVTFTNQAAGEMKERVGRMAGMKRAAEAMQIGTFHGICLGFLQSQGEEFTLIGAAQQQKLAEEAVSESGGDMKAGEFLQWISRRKSGVDMRTEEPEAVKKAEKFKTAFLLYEEKKQELGALDFDDLLLRTAERIENGQVQEGWEKPFRYLLVDEFQDINPVQYRLVKLWSARGRELFVIGDPDQSIYGFRGADSACFAHLGEEYPGLEKIRLLENYRSSPQILKVAQTLIRRDLKTGLRANCQENVPVRLVHGSSPLAEGIFIAKEIGRMAGGIGMLEAHQADWQQSRSKVRGFGEFAVLCRTHHQAELVEKCLRTESIPHIVAGREDYLETDVVRNSLCFFHAIENRGDITARQLCAEYFWKLHWNSLAREIVEREIGQLESAYQKKTPETFLKIWMEQRGLSENPEMKKLLQAAVFYSSMQQFMAALTLGEESDVRRCGGKQYTSDAVTIMTLHGSKGLEFPVVFLYGAEQGSIPLESEKHPADREEERRLFYVGMTRAKEELILTSSGEISEFLKKFPDGLIEEETIGKKKSAESWYQMSLFDLPADDE